MRYIKYINVCPMRRMINYRARLPQIRASDAKSEARTAKSEARTAKSEARTAKSEARIAKSPYTKSPTQVSQESLHCVCRLHFDYLPAALQIRRHSVRLVDVAASSSRLPGTSDRKETMEPLNLNRIFNCAISFCMRPLSRFN